jgi:hypothetical protein
MAELLFIVTTIYVAYVVYEAVGRKKKPEPSQPEISVASVEPPQPPVAEKAPEQPKATKPVNKAASNKPKAKSAATKKTTASSSADSLKNPKTGETAKLPGNYAFAKRWIKEALVEEGLLDKIYKNNELDSDATAKIQAALQQLKAMDKYQ